MSAIWKYWDAENTNTNTIKKKNKKNCYVEILLNEIKVQDNLCMNRYRLLLL